MKKSITLSTLLVLSVFALQAQVVENLFSKRSNLSKDFHQLAKTYQSLDISTETLSSIYTAAPSHLDLSIPFGEGKLDLILNKTTITAPGFSVLELGANGSKQNVSFEAAVFYQGKIAGTDKSIATVSIFNDRVMAVISDAQGNIVLGAIDDQGRAGSEYALYREADLRVPNPFACATSETPIDGGTVTPAGQQITQRENATGEPVDIYFECDNRFYLDKGSNTNNVVNYVLGFFNNTALLYANENINIQVSQISVWTTIDPEAAAGLNTSSTVLTSFASRMSTANYIGDYAHFLSTRSLGGGVAYLLNAPCATAKQFKTGVSGIYNTYNNFPTYSWTVEVVTHELGHNLGSNHTQWCGWTGGPLDDCYPVEGSCSPGPHPTNGGTIMSYCHLVSTGINLSNGFGQQPGDRIRQVVSAATCFGNCRMTIAIAKSDASCGADNGSATVTATDNIGALTYLWSNGQTGATLSGVTAGTYNVKVTDANGCQVLGIVTIDNSGTVLNASLTPGAATGFCAGGSSLLSVTANPAYNYQWYINSAPIPGATNSTFLANTAGLYSVAVVSGSCNVTKSVQVSAYPTPVVLVTPAISTIEKYKTQTLTASGASTYNWSAQPAVESSTINSAVVRPLTTTIYTIEGTDAKGCKATASATVQVIGCGDMVNLTASLYSPSRATIRWSNPPGVINDTLRYRKVGENTWTTIFVSGTEYEIVGLVPGVDYEYSVIPLCSTTNTFIASPNATFKTPGLTDGVYVRLYPNPVNSTAKLEVIVDKPFTMQVTVYDNTGRKVMLVIPTESFPAGQVLKPVSAMNLSAGVYHVVVNINGKNSNVNMMVGH